MRKNSMSHRLVQLQTYFSKGKKFVRIDLDKDSELHAVARQIEGCKWDEDTQSWLLENSREAFSSLFKAFHRKAWVNVDDLVGV